MRNTGLLIILAGVYIVVNSGSFRDLVMGKASIGFMTPSKKVTSSSKDFDKAHHHANEEAVEALDTAISERDYILSGG